MSECQPPNSDNNHLVLQEYPLQSHLLRLIPAKAQKALTTFDIEFTCIDADGHYIAIGSNIGIVYLFDRRKNHLSRLRNDNKEPITCVKVLISLECLVVFGCKSGAVIVFKIPFGSEEEFEKFTVEGLHNSPITSLEWVRNGIKFFSGDESGVVVCTEIDHFEHQSKSHVVLNDQSKIVQLSYSRFSLVISTLFRSIIYSCEDGSITKIGQKERKCYGPFGAIIFHDSSSSDNCIFASRPGQRLWKSDKSGVIHETMIFKNVLSEPHHVIKLLSTANDSNCLQDFQFGKLSTFNEKYILVSSDSSVVLIDPNQKSVLCSSPKLDPIVDVSACNDEIFVLRGLRHLIRISASPDPYPCDKSAEEPSLIEDILVPLKGLTTFVKERSDSLAAQTESTIFDWLRKKRSSSSPATIPDDTNLEKNQNEISNSQTLPEVVKLESKDYTPVIIDNPSPISVTQVPKVEITVAVNWNESEDIVYKPKKKHKKKVRFRSVSPKKTDRKALIFDSEESTSVNSDKLKPSIDSSTDVPSDAIKDSSSSDTIVPKSDETDSSDSRMVDSSSLIDSSDRTTCDSFSEFSDSNCKTTSDANTDHSCIVGSHGTSAEGTLSNDCIDAGNTACDNCDSDFQKRCENDSYLSNPCEKFIDPDDIYSSYDKSQCNPQDSELNIESTSVSSLSAEEITTTCVEVSDSELPKYGVDWVEYRAPDVLMDLSLSNERIFCVDIKNQLYFSNYPVLGLQWRKIDQPAEKISVSPSESIFWVLYKGVVFAAVQKSTIKWKEVEWMSIARDIISISVEDDCGWYITSSGYLTVQKNLTSFQPYGYPEAVEFKSDPPAFLQVSSWNKIIWILSVGGRLYTFDYKEKRHIQELNEIGLTGFPDIDCVFLGVQQTGWIIDSNGIIRFKIGVTRDSPEGIGKPWEVETSKIFVRDNGHLSKTVLRALNNETLSSLIRGKQHICLSTSSSGIWFCKTLDNALYANQKDIIGHKWESVIPLGTASANKWKLLSAEGISCSQGSVWCMNNTDELFCLSVTTNTLTTVQLPKIPIVQHLIPATQSLWLLSGDGMIFIRRGITPNCPEGVWWQAMDLTQLGSEQITYISCSQQVAWACTNEGRVLVRLGTLCPSSERRLAQAWIPISTEAEEIPSPIMEKLSAIGKKFPLPRVHPSLIEVPFTKVYVGSLGYPVWALDNRNNVYVREGVTANMPIGKKWTLVPELHAKSLSISKNAVWLLKISGKIFRRFGVTEKNPCGDYWKQIPGNMDYLSVTEDDDLWGLKDDAMFLHLSFVLNFTSRNSEKKPPVRSISEEDWEDIMVDTSDYET